MSSARQYARLVLAERSRKQVELCPEDAKPELKHLYSLWEEFDPQRHKDPKIQAIRKFIVNKKGFDK